MTSTSEDKDFTTLNSVVVGRAWRETDGYRLGDGVDAITGQSRPSAVKPFTVVPSKGKKVIVDHRFVQTDSDLKELISASVKGSYNLEGVELSGGLSFVSEVAVSELAVTLVQWRSIVEEEFALAPKYELAVTPGPDFRKLYGDYVVAGYRGGAQLYVMYQCRFSSAEDRTKFSAELAASVPQVFSAEGSAAFERISKKHQANVHITFATSVETPPPAEPAGGWTPKNIIEVLVTWFNSAMVMTKLESYLMHYRMIDPTISADIPIAPEAFSEVSLLYDRFWQVQALFGTCPDFGRYRLQTAYDKLKRDLEAYQSVLPLQKETRQRLSAVQEGLLTDLREISNRQSFYALAVKAIGSEPPQDKNFNADLGVTRWGYGLTAGNLGGVTVGSWRDEYKADWSGGGYVRHSFYFRDSTKVIVGWDVICNWGANGGDWWKACPQVIGRSDATITIKSDLWRGCNWSVIWYFVDAALYPPGPWTVEAIHSEGPVLMDVPDGDAERRPWTPERMAAAEPASGPAITPELAAALDAEWARIAQIKEAQRTPPPVGMPEAARTELVEKPDKYPQHTIGRLFFSLNGKDMVGSAVVVNRRGIMTAAHNLYKDGHYSREVTFVPAYDDGTNPFGKWEVEKFCLPSEYARTQSLTLDVAFCTTKAQEEIHVGDVVGELRLDTSGNNGPGMAWRSVGYPSKKAGGHGFDGGHMWQSLGDFTGLSQGLIGKEDGLTEGSSGGPWLSADDAKTVKGIQAAGNDGATRSYSPVFGNWVRRLYDQAFA